VDPLGERIAIGFNDTTAVEVYDAAALEWRFAADTKGVDNGNLMSVAWSADGSLYAGGMYNRVSKRKIRVWDQAGEGSAREIEGPANTILHLLPCGNGIAMSAADPAFGLLAPDGGRRVWREAVQVEMRGKRLEHFTVSNDGLRLRFGLKLGSDEPVLFDLAAEQLRDEAQLPSDLHAADIQSLPVTNWLNEFDPKLNGNPFGKLLNNEKVRSLAIAPDNESFILGTEYRLRAYNKGGGQLCNQEAPAAVWGVNIARANKLVIGAYSDGTIRWHRLDDGKELLANAAAKRPRDDDIMRRRPPVLTLVSPKHGDTFKEETVTIEYIVRSPSGLPVTRVRALIMACLRREAARVSFPLRQLTVRTGVR
jgi:hypothetical protein